MESLSSSEVIYLYNDIEEDSLLPFTFLRKVGDLKLGFDTLKVQWEHYLDKKIVCLTFEEKERLEKSKPDSCFLINAHCAPTLGVVDAIKSLPNNHSLETEEGKVIAKKFSSKENFKIEIFNEPLIWFHSLPDLFRHNEALIFLEFKRLTAGRKSQPIPKTAQVTGAENIFIEEGVTLNFATLNATQGPIYIGKNCEIMEGSTIRGGFILGEGSTVKMGAKIYTNSIIGSNCKIGGELNNVTMFSNSNKGHDGFLGNAVIGEWCNIGAGTDASNLKNDYGMVRIWDYKEEKFVKTELQFCGLMLGDYSRCAIQTVFNTATVVGVGCNIFGVGFPRTFIPSFSFGGASKLMTYQFKKAIGSFDAMKKRRESSLTEIEIQELESVFTNDAKFRKD